MNENKKEMKKSESSSDSETSSSGSESSTNSTNLKEINKEQIKLLNLKKLKDLQIVSNHKTVESDSDSDSSSSCSNQIKNIYNIYKNYSGIGNIPIEDNIKKIQNNYTWALKNDTQILLTPLTFQNIVFTSTPELNGWTYNNLSGEFTCNNPGKYLVSYIIDMQANDELKIGSIIGTINNVEILGSTKTKQLQSINQSFINFFIMNVVQNDKFILKFTGNDISVKISSVNPISGETLNSGSININKILNC
jgi:hypothetical protein